MSQSVTAGDTVYHRVYESIAQLNTVVLHFERHNHCRRHFLTSAWNPSGSRGQVQAAGPHEEKRASSDDAFVAAAPAAQRRELHWSGREMPFDVNAGEQCVPLFLAIICTTPAAQATDAHSNFCQQLQRPRGQASVLMGGATKKAERGSSFVKDSPEQQGQRPGQTR